MCRQRNRRGFTLIELSIGLVIIALMVAGVVTGKELIRAAELRTIMSEVDTMRAAANTFIGKYNCIPGDCVNATALGLGTSGNGNGAVDYGVCPLVSQSRMGPDNIEIVQFWQHLGNAGLIAGSYTGTWGTSYAAEVGVNIPASKVGNAGYSFGDIYNWPSVCALGLFPDADYHNSIVFGQNYNDEYGDFMASGYALTVEEAYIIDTKYDDGKPGKGRILNPSFTTYVARDHDYNFCLTGPAWSDPETAVYNIGLAGKRCLIYFTRTF